MEHEQADVQVSLLGVLFGVLVAVSVCVGVFVVDKDKPAFKQLNPR